MRNVTFYSFKGGTGRTTALLNTAYLLAKQNFFVVVIDLDLQSPGLTLLSEMSPLHFKGINKLGMIDFLQDLLNPEEERLIDLQDIAYRPRLIGREHLPATSEKFGDIMFIPAGSLKTVQDSQNYFSNLRDLPLYLINRAYPTGENKLLIKEIVNHVSNFKSEKLGTRKPDFIFFDTGAGANVINDILLNEVSDHVITFAGSNEQGRKGLEVTLKDFQKKIPLNNLPSKLSLVISNIAQGEEAQKERSLRRTKRVIEQTARWTSDRQSKEFMPELITIPYHPIITVSEEAIVKTAPFASPVESYKKLADKLALLANRKSHICKEIATETEQEIEKIIYSEKSDILIEKTSNKLHPMSSLLPWNLPCPDKNPRDFSKEFELKTLDYNHLLSLLKLSSAFSIEKKKEIISKLSLLNESQLLKLVSVLRDERRKNLHLPSQLWPELAKKITLNMLNWLDFLEEIKLLGSISEAVTNIIENQELIKLIGDYPIFWNQLIQHFYQRKEFNITEKLLKTTLELFPKDRANKLILIKILVSKESYQKAREQLTELYKLDSKQINFNNMAQTQLELSRIYLLEERLNQAESAAEEAVRLFEKADNKAQLGKTLKQQAKIALLNDHHNQAEKFLIQAFSIFDQIDNYLEMANIQLKLTLLYKKIEKLDKAETSCHSAYQLFKELKQEQQAAQAQLELANIYLLKNDLKIAEISFEKSFETYTKLGKQNKALVAKKELADIYYRTNQLELAEESYLECFNKHSKQQNKLAMSLDQLALAEIYLKQGRKKRAEEAFKKHFDCVAGCENSWSQKLSHRFIKE